MSFLGASPPMWKRRKKKKNNVRKRLGSALGRRVNGDLVGVDLVFAVQPLTLG